MFVEIKEDAVEAQAILSRVPAPLTGFVARGLNRHPLLLRRGTRCEARGAGFLSSLGPCISYLKKQSRQAVRKHRILIPASPEFESWRRSQMRQAVNAGRQHVPLDNMVVFTGNANPALTEAVARGTSGCPSARPWLTGYSDGR